MDGSSKKDGEFPRMMVHKVDGPSKSGRSIKWMDYPRRMEISPKVHKVDGSSKKDGNFVKSIKWTVHPRRMEVSLNT